MSVVARAKRRLPGPVTEAARAGVRAIGGITSASRAVPDFLILGAKRGGTTSMWNYLIAHPGVARMWPAAERLKSPHYFDLNYTRGEAWYRSHFPTRAHLDRLQSKLGHTVVTGEASPYYLLHPSVPARVHGLLPAAKLLVLLRDPVERAYSHYKERTRHGIETLSFLDALHAEEGRLAGETERLAADPAYTSEAHDSFSYLARGRYLEQLDRWWDWFPADQLLVLASEDFYADPRATLGQVTDFLGLPAHAPADYRKWNFHPAADMPGDARAFLLDYYRPHNDALQARLGRRLSWPMTSAERTTT